jgi:hypothetical protein
MLKIILAGPIAVLTFVGFSSDAFAQAKSADQNKVCEAVFVKIKPVIERLAADGKSADIRALFENAGCSGMAINVAKRPTDATGRQSFGCALKFPPPRLELNCGLI